MQYTHAAPELGAHTRQVLQQLLGLDEAALAALQSAGVVTMSPEPEISGKAVAR